MAPAEQGEHHLTRQNRILPTGEIVAHPARGTLMGNRGILHDESGRLGRARWRHPHWIACLLEFRGRWRPVMAPRAYTELFFLDEAVALAVGHRPCAECRRADYARFLDAWQDATGNRPRAKALDGALHASRLVPGTQRQATFAADARSLPDGAFVRQEGAANLVFDGRLLPFAPTGYGSPGAIPGGEVETLTPRSIVGVLRAGYRPHVHPSAFG